MKYNFSSNPKSKLIFESVCWVQIAFHKKRNFTYQLKNQFRFRVGTEIVIDLKWES